MTDPSPPHPATLTTPDRQTPMLLRTGTVATAVIVAVWAVIGALMLLRPVFISHDSLSNNVHVWFIADQLWSGHGIPMHVPALANGQALTFPYASIPWTTAALLWPLLGDRAVTLWLVLGFVATVLATFWTFPTLRRGWWAAATLTNPALVISPLLGQLPFLWSIAAFTAAIGLWQRRRVVPAIALTAVASIIHPAVVMPIVALAVAAWLPFEDGDRRRSLVGSEQLLAHACEQDCRLERLEDVTLDAELDQLADDVAVALGGEHDQRRPVALVAQPDDEIVAVHAEHVHIAQDQVHRRDRQRIQCLLSARGLDHVQGVVLQRGLDIGADDRDVVDDQDTLLHHRCRGGAHTGSDVGDHGIAGALLEPRRRRQAGTARGKAMRTSRPPASPTPSSTSAW